jgi:carbon monoxide dehydrogenase subunit G
MEMSATRSVPASVEATWRALNDPQFLKECVPGCEQIEATAENEYKVVMAAKVGPVSARFTGRMVLSNLQPPTAYDITFEGQGGAAGFAKGQAHVALVPEGTDATAMSYTVTAQVGGKLAQIGSRLIDGAARKVADDFFSAFIEKIGRERQDPKEVATEVPIAAASAESSGAAAWLSRHRMVAGAGAVIAIAAVWLLTRLA